MKDESTKYRKYNKDMILSADLAVSLFIHYCRFFYFYLLVVDCTAHLFLFNVATFFGCC